MAQDDLDARIDALTEEDLARGLAVFRSRLTAQDVANLQSCVRCGLCADSCHYHRAEPGPAHVPMARLQLADAVFRGHFTALGRWAPVLAGARRLDREMARAWLDAAFGRCSLCGRCTLNCVMGINLPRIHRAMRGALAAMGLVPADLQATVDQALATGNNMGIDKADWIETVRWIEEELREELQDPTAELPLDRQGARILFTVNPREPKFFPLSLQASAQVFHAAGESWTLASDAGWDLTNYGLFTCRDDHAGVLAENLKQAMARLGCEELVIGECGHGWAAARWEAPGWLGSAFPFRVRSVLELLDEYVASHRIQVDPRRNPEPITLHDPCNLVRHGGVCEAQRRVLRACCMDFREMTPNRERNFCCGGGGGQLSMARYRARRLKAGGVKAAQIRDTGARFVATPCHNCIDQLSELNREYKLKVQTRTVTEVVARALVPSVPSR